MQASARVPTVETVGLLVSQNLVILPAAMAKEKLFISSYCGLKILRFHQHAGGHLLLPWIAYLVHCVSSAERFTFESDVQLEVI